MSETESKLDQYGPIISWIAGGFVLLMAVSILTAGTSIIGIIRGVLGAIVLVVVAGVLIPPVRRLITSRSGYELSRGAVIGIALLGLFVGVGIAPSLDTPDEDEPVDGETPADAPTTTPGPTSTPEPTSESTTKATPTPPSTPTPTPAPAKDGESYSFSGSGNVVTDSFTTEGGLVVFDFDRTGDSNFQVQAVSSEGDEEFLVNHIGDYDGKVALYLPSNEWNLDITADGSWTVDVTQPRFDRSDIESLPAESDGEHAAWFGPFEFEGSTEVTFEIKNDGQAGVWLATHEGVYVDLLHNEIGPYEGTALITDEGIGLIIIDTDGAEWRIEIGG